MSRRGWPRRPVRCSRILIVALCVALWAGGPAAGALGTRDSSDPPTKPELHPFRECSEFCDASYSIIESRTPLLSAVSTDPDSPALTYTFTIEDWMTDALLASEEFVARPGDDVRWQVPEGVLAGDTVYRWNVTVHDESTTVSDDRYFAYREPDGPITRVLAALEEPAFAVLLALPYVGAGVAVLGLVILPWRRRAGLRTLLGGLAVAAIAVLILFSILARIGS